MYTTVSCAILMPQTQIFPAALLWLSTFLETREESLLKKKTSIAGFPSTAELDAVQSHQWGWAPLGYIFRDIFCVIAADLIYSQVTVKLLDGSYVNRFLITTREGLQVCAVKGKWMGEQHTDTGNRLLGKPYAVAHRHTAGAGTFGVSGTEQHHSLACPAQEQTLNYRLQTRRSVWIKLYLPNVNDVAGEKSPMN